MIQFWESILGSTFENTIDEVKEIYQNQYNNESDRESKTTNILFLFILIFGSQIWLF